MRKLAYITSSRYSLDSFLEFVTRLVDASLDDAIEHFSPWRYWVVKRLSNSEQGLIEIVDLEQDNYQ